MWPFRKRQSKSPDGECDSEIFHQGESLAVLNEGNRPPSAVNTWLAKVASAANARLDWHFSGGWAHVLHLGDAASRERAVTALELFNGTDGIRVQRIFPPGTKGLYRQGVTPVRPGATSFAFDGSTTETHIE